MFHAFTSTVKARSSSSLSLVLWDGENLHGCIFFLVFGKYTNEKIAGQHCCLFLHFAPLSIILFPLVFRSFCPQLPPSVSLWSIHSPPFLPHFLYSSKTPSSSIILCSHLFLSHSLFLTHNPFIFIPHHPLFLHLIFHPVFFPSFFLSLSSSPPTCFLSSSPFMFLLFTLPHNLSFSFYSCFLFTLPPKLTILFAHPSLICPFLSLLSSSPLLLPLPLIYNHNSIPLPLNSAPTLTSPS